MIFYYTATGNSLYIAKQFGDEQVLSIPQMIKEGRKEFKDTVIGFVAPDYASELPNTVRQFIEDSTFEAEYVFFIVTYGKEHSIVCEWAKEFAEKNGVHINYCSSLLMVDNYLPSFDMNEEKAIDKKIPEQVEKIQKEIAERKEYVEVPTEHGRELYQLVKQRGVDHPEWNSGEKIQFDSEKCIGCGICAKVCPIHNIEIKDGKANRISHICDYCSACVHACPKNAYGILDEKNPNARYRNENITLKEIMDSNN